MPEGPDPVELPLPATEGGETNDSRSIDGRGADAPTDEGLLAAMARDGERVPRILLRDMPDAGEPRKKASPDGGPGDPDDSGRYRLLGEIARGGMGVVFKGRDVDLGRNLAIKVLLEQHRDNPDIARRFVEEAQIGGQLQHPGIVPVHALGRLPDGRPFFAMKLVKGQTLAELLAARTEPAHDLPRFLTIFEQVCQTVAYAHARGVIHRDLKPHNIMVGSFGEVQVMDWGLAKVLVPGSDPAAPEVSEIRTVRSGKPDSGTEAGALLGTPAYMAPEQAQGERDGVDEQADVFGLGAILCQILTGRPPYVGRSSDEVRRKAVRAELAEAMDRLEGCGVDAELIGLARACLAPEPIDRPRDAARVAAAVSSYRAGVAERLRLAELARVEEQGRAEQERQARILTEARVVQERRARRLTAALAASILALAALAGGTGWWIDQQDRARSARVTLALGDARLMREQARAMPPWDTARWHDAHEALKRAEALLAGGGAAATRRLLGDLLDEIEAAEKDGELLRSLTDIRSAEGDDPDGTRTDAEYSAAFLHRGLDLDRLAPPAAAAAIRARPAPVAVALAAALDHWAAVRRNHTKGTDRAQRLVEIARQVDPDPYRDQIRATLLPQDVRLRRETWRRLAEDSKAHEQPVQGLVLLARLLATDSTAKAVDLLRKAQQEYPTDVWVNFELAKLLSKLRPSQRDEAIRFYSVARALRPETAHDLAHALERRGNSDEAIAVFRDLARLRPKVARHQGCLGSALKVKGDLREAARVLDAAIVVARDLINLKPNDAFTHDNLGYILGAKGDNAGAIAEFREAIRLRPIDAYAHLHLGLELGAQGDHAGAIAEFREAIRLRPDDADAHNALGADLAGQGDHAGAIPEFREANRLRPDSAEIHRNLARALSARGDKVDAIAELREVVRLKPDNALAQYSLGHELVAQGDHAGAIASYREAIRLKPDYAEAHVNLGIGLSAQGDHAGAIAEFREAIRLKPVLAEPHLNLGSVLKAQGDAAGAIAEYREAIRLRPDDDIARTALGFVLRAQGDAAGAIAEFREAIRLKPVLAEPHLNLGSVLRAEGDVAGAIAELREAIRLKPDHVTAHRALGAELAAQGDKAGAIAEYREAIRLKPDNALAQYNLANALSAQGDRAGAITGYREAIRIKPDYAEAHVNLGAALSAQGDAAGGIAEFRQAIRINPDLHPAHTNLGAALSAQGDNAGAIAEYREAIRIKGDAATHCHLGLSLRQTGAFSEALAALKQGHELGVNDPKWRFPSAKWLHDCERLVDLERRLQAILRGEDEPLDVDDRFALGEVCYCRALFGSSARYYAEALTAKSNLTDTEHRYRAARAAALAGTGRGKDDLPVAEEAGALWRSRALRWIRAELERWARGLEGGDPRERAAARRGLAFLQTDTDFADLRGEDALAKLPEAERSAWRSFWLEVDSLGKKAGGKPHGS